MSWWSKKRVVEGSDEPEVACWFCKKTKSHVRLLIAGPDGVNICEECVHICDEIVAKWILEDPRNRGSLDVRGGEVPGDPESIQCGLCRMPAPLESGLIVPDRGVLCEDCVLAVREMAAQFRE